MATGLSKLATAGLTFVILSWIGPEPTVAQVTLDGTVNPNFTGRAPFAAGNYDIRAELGHTEGRNLFHSFGKFSLRTGESATFSAPNEAGIRRVISRVTGGAPSDIDGTLRSTIPGADFYFLNPAGIAFGPNARLDLQGSFHVSTADELRFADGAKFSATDPAASSFTVEAPEAFGFLGPSASIRVNQSILEVPSNESLSLVGGDITIRGDPDREDVGRPGTVRAEAGQITLAAVGSAGKALLDSGTIDAARKADISLTDEALVETSGNGSGRILIRGGRLLIQEDSLISADNTGVMQAVGGVEIDMDEVELRTGSKVTADVLGSGGGGNVRVEARTLDIGTDSALAADTYAAGDAGFAVVEVDQVHVVGRSAVISSDANPGSTGSPGFVLLTANEQLTLSDGGEISSSTFVEVDPNSATERGLVSVTAREAVLSRGGIIRSGTFGSGDAGFIFVDADQLRIVGAPDRLTGISGDATSSSTGSPGTITVTVKDQLSLADGGTITTSSFGEPDSTVGRPGVIFIDAGELEIRNGGSIVTDTSGAADAGLIEVKTDQLRIVGAPDRLTGIFSDANRGSTGAPGSVGVTVDDLLTISDGGRISSSSFAEAESDPTAFPGAVTVTARELEIRNGGSIVTDTSGAADAGLIEVKTDQLRIVGAPDRLTGIFSDANRGSTGNPGSILVTVDNHLTISHRGRIGSSTFSEIDTQPGLVKVTAGNVELTTSGVISTTTFAAGAAGFVVVEAGAMRIFGDGSDRVTGIVSNANPDTSGNAGVVDVDVTSGPLVISGPGAEIGSATRVGSIGAAGFVFVNAPIIELRNLAGIRSSNEGSGAAGTVTVEASDSLLLRDGEITTASTSAGGGAIELRVGEVIDLRDSAVTTSVAVGDEPTAGSIMIDPRFLVIDGSTIKADALTGAGGNIEIFAENVIVREGDLEALLARGDISASGETEEVAGTIAINAPEVDLSGGLVVLEGRLLDAASQLRARCGARRDVGASSFTRVGRGGLPPSPDGPLVSAYVVDEAAVDAARKAGARLTTATAPGDVRLVGLSAPCTPLN